MVAICADALHQGSLGGNTYAPFCVVRRHMLSVRSSGDLSEGDKRDSKSDMPGFWVRSVTSSNTRSAPRGRGYFAPEPACRTRPTRFWPPSVTVVLCLVGLDDAEGWPNAWVCGSGDPGAGQVASPGLALLMMRLGSNAPLPNSQFRSMRSGRCQKSGTDRTKVEKGEALGGSIACLGRDGDEDSHL